MERADVLICTKVWFDDLGYDPALKSVAGNSSRDCGKRLSHKFAQRTDYPSFLALSGSVAALAASNARLSLEGDRGADLVLIHFPGTIDSVQSPAKNKQLRLDTWRALERLKQQGEVKAIGISK